jgi:3-methyladenine DNA glycosylase AlkD
MMDTAAERRRLVEQVEARADARYQQVVQRSVPSNLRVYGLRVWEIRQIVRGWRRHHRDVSWEALLPLVEQLLQGKSREERLLALELLAHYPLLIPLLTWEQLDTWRQDLDNWELTDVLGREVLGPWVAAQLEKREQRLWDLVGEQGVWSRRLGLVGILGLNRARSDPTSLALALALVDQVKHERDATISRAVSWVLRELARNHPSQVATYLDENEGLLARHVIREVRSKLETGRKNGRSRAGTGRAPGGARSR